MSEQPTAEQTAIWQRRLASQANNRAWTLSEASSRTPEEDEEMLHAAHAAMYFWRIVGNAKNHARAAQLLAHTYALLRLGSPAKHYLAKSNPVFFGEGAEPWELAMTHAVAANVAAATGDSEAHGTHYAEAARLIAALPDPENRAILSATLRVVPVPSEGASAARKADAMLHHISLGVSDLERAARFYDAALLPLGYVRVWSDATGVGYGPPDGGDKLALKLRPQRQGTSDPGFHLAFAASSPEAVVRFHEAAIANGGKNNGTPGPRPDYGPGYYAAFAIDPDGYHIEAGINACQ